MAGMDRNAWWKWLLLAVLVGTSVWMVVPLDKQIRLGLDIKGGSSFAVVVDEDRLRQDIIHRLSTNSVVESAGVEAAGTNAPAVSPEAVEKEMKTVREGAIDRALIVLRNRIDEMGIAEPEIYTEEGRESKRIIIKLPGIEPERRAEAEKNITSVAYLEFRLVHKRNQELTAALFDKQQEPKGYRISSMGGERVYVEDSSFAVTNKTDAYRKELAQFHVPDAYHEFMLEKVENQSGVAYKPFYVKIRPELEGNCLAQANRDWDPMSGKPHVSITLTREGTVIFRRVTTDHSPRGEKNANSDRGRQLAIVLDGRLYSAPELIQPIHDGQARITGSFTDAEVSRLVNVLNSGHLLAPVKIIERRTVSPTLGMDAVRSGITASIAGCIAIGVVMLLYYTYSGLLGNFALVLNIVLLPLSLYLIAGFLGVASGARVGTKVILPVLTLPGIAGIALTIGMAVDANVLIFERIREELQSGKGVLAAVQAGYHRAFSAIFDSNITTLITAIILFMLGGAGPVRGYAVMLAGGLLVSLYTAVVVTRMCFDATVCRTQNAKLLKMFQLFKETKIDFINKWKIAVSISILLILVGCGTLGYRMFKDPRAAFGVDFVGGASVTASFTQEAGVEFIRSELAAGGVQDASIQYQSELEGVVTKRYLQVKVPDAESGAKVETILASKFPQCGFKFEQHDEIGPQIGAEMRNKAGWAIFWSLVAMVVYIWIRFELGFALGAVAAVFHDALITAGIVHLLGFQLNMFVVAALMTIIGYSVNDTIVIFDRVRENLRSVKNMSFTDICNLSMNQTLARTILTNVLTFMSVLSLVIFGGGAIKDFSVTMLIGMIAGTYSTIYIATPVVLLYYGFKTPDLGAKHSK